MPRSNAALETELFDASRREDDAEATRHPLVDAANVLFSEKGYFATKADEIAALARVTPATVFAVIAAEMLGRTMQMDDPAAIVQFVAQVCCRMREDFGDTVRAMIAATPHDPRIAEIKAVATSQYRAAFVPVAQRLFDLDALRDSMDVPQAVDVFWFCFGYAGLFVLRDNNCWSFARSEQWLREEASRALLR